MIRVSLYTFAILSAVLAATSAGADTEVRVGSGANCFSADIQTAINTAVPANGITNIRIARNATYDAQQLDINGRDVRLYGGYADCNQAVADSTKTVVNGAGGGANTVFTVRGSTHVVAFYNLDVTGGDEVTSSAGKAGGIAVAGGPHDLVIFDNVSIHDNQAGYGGGVFVRNEFSTDSNDVYLYMGDNVMIDSNYAAYGGGGIWCADARVVAVGSNSRISRNTTAGTVGMTVINGPGGGIRAENCQMWIGATSNLGTLTLNEAGGNGGGLSVSGERASVRFYTRSANRPSFVLSNTAGGLGGGIDVGSSAHVTGYDLVVANNIARVGGAGVSLFDNDDAPDATLTMEGTLAGAPADPQSPEGVAVNCNAALHCNRISDNLASDIDGTRRPGAAARIDVYDTVTFPSHADPTLELYGTQLSGNDGESLVRTIQSGLDGYLQVLLDGALVVDNVVTGTLLQNPGGGFATAGRLDVRATTIAGNAIGGADVIRTVDSYELRSSIVWQPGKRTLNVLDAGANITDVDYLLTSDLTGIPASTHNLIADPKFEDPASGNYRLRLDSPGVDYAPQLTGLFDVPVGIATADHLSRIRDLSSVPNEFGAQDVGAYERQFACANDTIFCGGFEF
jgi:hypothetical protein